MSGTTTSPPIARTAGNTCDVLSLLKNGGAFSGALMNQANAIMGQITSTISSLTNMMSSLTGAALQAVQSAINSLTTVVTQAVSALMGHIQQQLGNLVRHLSIAVSDLSNSLGLSDAGCAPASAPPPSDPCASMQDFFGLLMGAGSSLLNGIASKLTSMVGAVTGPIGEVLGVINDAMGAINSAVSSITSAITSEAGRLLKAITDALDFGNAFALNNLFKNPCAQGVLNAVGTPALLGALGR